MKNLFRLELLDIGWLDTLPEEEDRCAHGKVLVQIGNTVLSDAQSDTWTVSAAALYLLRTLTTNHTTQAPIGDQLLPCCGFAMWPDQNSDDVFICGCPNGIDWEVQHKADSVLLSIVGGSKVVVPLKQYQQQVLAFADAVEQYYESGRQKTIPEDVDDAAGYVLFWQEWQRRRRQFQ